MITLIPLGGESRRFYEAGYRVPKPCLPWQGSTVINAVIEGLRPSILVTEGNTDDEWEIFPAIQEATGRCPNCRRWQPHWSTGPAMGPIFGLLNAAPALASIGDDELLVSYCDVILTNTVVESLIRDWHLKGARSGGVIFKSDDPRYGYWTGYGVAEKAVISEWAVSGVFYFVSWRVALVMAAQSARKYNGFPSLLDSQSIMLPLNTADIIDVGTPADYELYAKAKAVAA